MIVLSLFLRGINAQFLQLQFIPLGGPTTNDQRSIRLIQLIADELCTIVQCTIYCVHIVRN